MNKIGRLLQEAIATKLWGDIVIKFRNGIPVFIQKKEDIKISEPEIIHKSFTKGDGVEYEL